MKLHWKSLQDWSASCLDGNIRSEKSISKSVADNAPLRDALDMVSGDDVSSLGQAGLSNLGDQMFIRAHFAFEDVCWSPFKADHWCLRNRTGELWTP